MCLPSSAGSEPCSAAVEISESAFITPRFPSWSGGQDYCRCGQDIWLSRDRMGTCAESACRHCGGVGGRSGWPLRRMWGDHMRGNMACLAGAHDWSDWEVSDPEQPGEQVRICARCLRAQKSGDRRWGRMACLVGVHHWSGWEVPDQEQSWNQVRTCARCRRTKDNAAPVPLRSLFW